MVDRTHGHTRDAAERLYANSNVEERAKSAFFAPILPLENTQQLLYLEELQDELRDYISGLALYESASLTVIPEALGDLPRLLFNEPASPHEVLKEISLGADLITLPFLVESSDSGMALDFVFPPPTPEQAPPRQLASNMWSPTHATDLSTLSENCKCFTCQNHHRAYLNHLLNAKEMLAWTLLQIHNHHVLDNFFAGVRESIKNGTFEQDAEAFHKVYAPTFPERTGQGPRYGLSLYVDLVQWLMNFPGSVATNYLPCNRSIFLISRRCLIDLMMLWRSSRNRIIRWECRMPKRMSLSRRGLQRGRSISSLLMD